MKSEPQEREGYSGLYTQWNSVTDQIYMVHYSFMDRMSAINGLSNTKFDKRVEVEIIGAIRDLYKLYKLCLPAKAFPLNADENDLKRLREICTSKRSRTTIADLNWASDKVTEWFMETGFLSVSVPKAKKFGKTNAMAEWHATGY